MLNIQNVYSRLLSHTASDYMPIDANVSYMHVRTASFRISSPLLYNYAFVGIRSAQFGIEWSCRRMHILIGFENVNFLNSFHEWVGTLCGFWFRIIYVRCWWIVVKLYRSFRDEIRYLLVNLATMFTGLNYYKTRKRFMKGIKVWMVYFDYFAFKDTFFDLILWFQIP